MPSNQCQCLHATAVISVCKAVSHVCHDNSMHNVIICCQHCTLAATPAGKNSMRTHLLAHRTMPFKVFVLLDFMIKLNIDGVPVKVFTHTAAWLMYVLTVAEGTPMGNEHLLRSPGVIVIVKLRLSVAVCHWCATEYCFKVTHWVWERPAAMESERTDTRPQTICSRAIRMLFWKSEGRLQLCHATPHSSAVMQQHGSR